MDLLDTLLPPGNKSLGQGNVFTQVCLSFCSQVGRGCIPACIPACNDADEFSVASGLKVNYSKSNVVRIGANKDKGALIHGLNFKWLNSLDFFTYLGLKINIDDSFVSENFDFDNFIVSDAVSQL